MGFVNTLPVLYGEPTNFQELIEAHFWFEVCLWLQVLSGKPHLNMLWEATVAQAPRAHFDPCRSEGLFFSIPRLWKPCPARCLETRLLPVSHPAVAFGDRVVSLGLEVDLQCFIAPVEKNRKLAMEIELPHPSRHLCTLYTLLPLKPKHQGMTWNLSCVWRTLGLF